MIKMTESSTDDIHMPKHLATLTPKFREWVLILNDGTHAKVLSTHLYTVIQPFWTTDWIFKILDIEREVGHAICGWPTSKGTPCKCHPIPEDKIENIKMIGKCGRHSRPEISKSNDYYNDHSIEELKFNDIDIIQLPSYKMLMSMAENLLPTCTDCDFRFKCNERDKDYDRCVIQKKQFEKFMTGIIKENRLVEISDQILAFTLVTAFMDFIKTLRFEANRGLSDTIDNGMMGLRIQLNRLIQQNMRTLAIDRKTRLFIKKDGKLESSNLDFAKLIAESDIHEVTKKTRPMTVTSVKSIPRTFQGVDGDLIIDQEIDASSNEEEQ